MEAKDLRLGNFVLFRGDVLDFDENSWDNIVNRLSSIQPMDDYKPIPLTEDWLVKFGFENYMGNHWERDGDMQIEKSDTMFYLSVGSEYHASEPFKFVHQLQNLYFALTGKELQCK